MSRDHLALNILEQEEEEDEDPNHLVTPIRVILVYNTFNILYLQILE